MIDVLLSLPDWIGAAIAMSLTTVIGLTVYAVSYRMISRARREDMRDPTGNLFRVVGILVSLMLSLAFADVIIKSRAIENALAREAAAIVDTFHSLRAFDLEQTRDARALLIDYAQSVIDDDWPALADDRLGDRTGSLRRRLAARVMELQPSTPVQEQLWTRLLTDLDAISDHRLVRLDNALAEPPVFVYVVIFGFVITMACFGAYRPQPPLVALVALYTLFIGFVLYLVIALSDPYRGGFGVTPTVFETMVEKLRLENAKAGP